MRHGVCNETKTGKGKNERKEAHKRSTYMIPIPSINAKSTPPTAAALAMARGPARAARIPPVAAPEIIEFHGSSFCLKAVSVQSQQANIPPHTANCPPRTGDRAWTALKDPAKRAPAGEIQAPLTVCHIPPPIAPMQKAPPTSSTIRHGQGSRSAIPDCRGILNRDLCVWVCLY